MVYDSEMITVDGVTTLTASKLAMAVPLYGQPIKTVICTVETNKIRVRCDGGNPTAELGHILEVGDVLYIDGSDVDKFRAIKVVNAGKLAVSYEV